MIQELGAVFTAALDEALPALLGSDLEPLLNNATIWGG